MQKTLTPVKQRINSIDILRGIIMVVMALDHVRDFYSNASYDPLDLTQTSPQLFLTRWITHFCAPTFVFLSGTGAFLSLSRGKKKKEASLFLLTRGLWLVFLELTIIGFGWNLDTGFHQIFAQVIWAIGWSMVVLAALVFLRPVYVAVLGLAMIFGHNLLDGIHAASFGEGKLFWLVLHELGFAKINSYESVFVLYPLVPWVGVMAVGYAFGTLYKLEQHIRKPLLLKIGLGCLALFILLRWLNIYGDPFPTQPQATWWKSILAFIKCHKYPPSLLYILMTLGVSVTALYFLENINNKVNNFFLVFGRVPLFYYILHLYLIHLSQVIATLALGFSPEYLKGDSNAPHPFEWGFGLPIVYLVWVIVVAILYFPSRWFMKVKQRRKDWWLSYL